MGDDVSDWTVTKVVLSAKLASNESFIFQVGRACRAGRVGRAPWQPDAPL